MTSVAKPSQEIADLRGVVLDGRYEIGQPLSAGGMGTVYRGQQLALRRDVAIKLVKPGVMNRDIQVRRLVREAQTTAMVKHPNVIEIIDVGVMQHGFVYLVMEQLEGTDLRALLRKERKLDWPRARNITMQVVSALKAAHAQGVIHRDVKPSNVFMVGQAAGVTGDFIKVLDFGLAKCRAEGRTSTLTGADEVVGTAAYLAPEVARGKKADFRSEVYAVGVLMYKMATGTVPFRGSNPLDVLAKAISNPVPAPRSHTPDLPDEADKLIRRCLAKRPELRPQSMDELERDLYKIGGSDFVQGFDEPALPSSSEVVIGHTQITPPPQSPAPSAPDPLPPAPKASTSTADAATHDEDPSDVLEAAISEVLELGSEDMVEVDSGAAGFLLAAKADDARKETRKPALRLVPDPEPTPLPVRHASPELFADTRVREPSAPHHSSPDWTRAPTVQAPPQSLGDGSFADALPRDSRGFSPALTEAPPRFVTDPTPEPEVVPVGPPKVRRGLTLLLLFLSVPVIAVLTAVVLVATGVMPMPLQGGANASARLYPGILGDSLPVPQPTAVVPPVAAPAPVVAQPVAQPVANASATAVPVPAEPAAADPTAEPAPADPTAEPAPPEPATAEPAPPEPATAESEKPAPAVEPKPAPKAKRSTKRKPRSKKRSSKPAPKPAARPTPAAPKTPPPAPPAPKAKKKRPKPKSSSSDPPWKRVPVPSDNW